MSLTGGKRKVNKSLKAWVAFVKKVQKEEKLSYKDAIHRAKVRKDKGEKWMTGGDIEETIEEYGPDGFEEEEKVSGPGFEEEEKEIEAMAGGRRRTRRMRRGKSRARGRTARRARRRSSRRH